MALIISLDIYLVLDLVLLIVTWVRQLQYNPYSYNSIYYIGFAVFVFTILASMVARTFEMAADPEYYTINNIITVATSVTSGFMLYSGIPVLMFSVFLCASNIALIRHEGRSFANILGIILSFLLVGGIVVYWIFDYYASGSMFEVMIHDVIACTYSSVFVYYESMMIGTIIMGGIVSRYKPEYDKDFVIILGCGLLDDGTPTPLLRGRIDRALEFYKEQKEKTGKELVFVPSGGQGADEPWPESTAMKRYLMEHGIPESRIIEEDQSTDTMENMRFSKEKIEAVNKDGKVIFSTTNFHIFRSGLCARRVKMRAVGIGAKTRWYFWPNASVREFVGLLTEHRLKQALVFGGMVLFYVGVTLAVYR